MNDTIAAKNNKKVLNIDKKKFEKQIEVLGFEIAELHISIIAMREIIEQSNVRFDVYVKFYEFLLRTYRIYYDDVIHGFSRLQDLSRGSLSVLGLLDQIDQTNGITEDEKIILEQIKLHPLYKKVKNIRNKLGRAHIDGNTAINLDEQKKIIIESAFEIEDLGKYLELLTQGLEVLSEHLDQAIVQRKPNTAIRFQIRMIFELLSKNLNAL